MKNKIIVGLVSSMLLTTFAPFMGSVVLAEEPLKDLIEQKENNEGRSKKLDSVIEQTEAEMNSLEQERQELEGNIQSLQITVQELTEDLDEQNQNLVETNEEIKKLNKEIKDLTKAIELRNDKLMTQARATQTKWNPTNVIHMIISAEDISDLVSRIGIVSKLVSANQQVIEDQRRDQEAVIKAEAQVQIEKAEVETLVVQIETNREELTVQQVELDNEIMHVAKKYNMNSSEKDQFVSEQFELAQETMALSTEIRAEEKRIEEERIAEEKRLEEERLAEEKRLEEERLAEEKRLEEEAIAKEAEEEKQRQVEAERKEQVALAAEQRREEAEKEEASLVAERNSAEQRRSEREKAAEQRAAAENRQEQERLDRVEAERVANAEAEARAQATASANRREAEREAAAQAAANRREEERKAAAAQAQKEKEQAATSSSNNTSTSAAPTSSGWVRPASGYISSPFGYRVHPVTGQRSSFHAGVDIAGSGSIRASRAGTVTAASYAGSYGYRVIVDHGDGYSTLYAHMQPNLSVSPGQRVSQGQQLGIMGTTGRSTGVHLHFEVRRNGRAVNPMGYIN